MGRNTQTLKEFARQLRTNLTESEKKLWSRLRGRQLAGWRFYRQKAIANYIVDFYCHSPKMAIELDGGQHYTANGEVHDKTRDRYLRTCGIRVLRFSNTDVIESTEAVLEAILDAIAAKNPPESPPSTLLRMYFTKGGRAPSRAR